MLVMLRARVACRGDGVTVDAWRCLHAPALVGARTRNHVAVRGAHQKLPRPAVPLLARRRHCDAYSGWHRDVVVPGDGLREAGNSRQFPRLYHDAAALVTRIAQSLIALRQTCTLPGATHTGTVAPARNWPYPPTHRQGSRGRPLVARHRSGSHRHAYSFPRPGTTCCIIPDNYPRPISATYSC
jgi:hypothetical protein